MPVVSGPLVSCLPLVMLFLVCSSSAQGVQAAGQRLIVKHEPLLTSSVVAQAQQHGLGVLGQSHAAGVLVLSTDSGSGGQAGAAGSSAAQLQGLVAQVQQWPGVQHVEQDQPRFLHFEDGVNRPAQGGGGGDAQDCTARDMPVYGNSLLPEYMPYGVAQIQANSKKLPTSTDKSGVMVCIIDSGIDASHQDFVGNSDDGCKLEDAFAPGGCPYKWSEDMISHGTHVAGTISARRNGVGVIGVIPDGAEVYMIRVFNDSGDVNQGQGLVYGSTLILAYTQCEGRLAALQSRDPLPQYRMIVSMSLGAPGPLTIEQMFFREAGKRGDVLFVGSSGNNGSTPTLAPNGELTTGLNPANYPGTYPEVIGVSAVDCNNKLGVFSQKHPAVDIAAPGVDILSTASRQVPSKAGLVRSAFQLDGSGGSGPKLQAAGGIAGSTSQIRFAATGKVSGRVVDCGDGSKPCPDAQGGICLVQWDPQMASAAGSKPPPGSGGSTSKNGSSSSSKTGSGNSSSGGSNMGRRLLRWLTGAQQSVPQPAKAAAAAAPPQMPPAPTKFTCELMEFCVNQGAKAALFAAPALTSGYYPDWGWSASSDGLPEFASWPFFANLKCSAFNCSCWNRLQGRAILPAAGLTLKQYGELQSALKGSKELKGTVEAQSDLYQRLSGTSMAVPHVSGALARIWAKFPNCPSDVVRKSIEVTAKDLGPPGKDPMYGYGLLQAEAAYEWLAKQECAQIQLVMTMTEQGQKQQQLGGGQQQPPQRQKAGGEQKQEQPQGQKTGGEQKQQQGRRLADGSSSARQSSLLAQLARPAAGWRQDITEGQ